MEMEQDNKKTLLLNRLMNLAKDSLLVKMIDGIIHNLRGPITNIRMQMELFKIAIEKEELEDIKDINRPIDNIMTQIDEIEEIIENIQRVGLPEETNKKTILNLNDIVRDLSLFLKSDLFFKHNVEKKFELARKVIPVEGKYSDICFLLWQILKNAIEALYDTGYGTIKISTYREADWSVVRITDSGSGIVPEHREKIFEPFFTTKKGLKDKGKKVEHDGLGLYFANIIIKEHKGKIDFESTPQKTTFFIRFPRAF